MQLTIEIEVQDCESSDISVTNQCETLTLEIIDAPVSSGVSIDDAAGIGDTDVTWSADKSASELADKVDKEVGLGLSELSFTTVDKLSLDQSEQDRHTHSNKTVIDDLSDDAGVLQYKGLPISDQAALGAKVDKVAGKSLVDDTEIAKLATVQENATANRADIENADKVHGHVIADVAELAAKLELINQWLQVPADKKYFDFVGNRYSADGMPATVSSLSTFTRLSTATQWKDGVLVDVSANVMRLDKATGLLIEKSSTELIPNNSTITSISTAWTATQTTDTQIGNVFDFVSDGSVALVSTNIPVYPAGNVSASSGYYYRSVLAKKTDVDSYFIFGAGSSAVNLALNLRDGSVDTVGGRVAQHKVTLIGHYYLIETLSTENGASARQLYFYASNNKGIPTALETPTAGHKVTIAFPLFRDTADFPQSIIKTKGVQSTRTKETLVVPFETGQVVTADKDVGVIMTITGTNAVFEGHGYIRNVRVN